MRLIEVQGVLAANETRSGERLASSNDDWLERVRAGDAVALNQLARQEMPRVTRLLCSMLGPRADLEDLVQTVFMEACKALPRFRGDSSVSTFIGGITVHVARRAMRPSAWFRYRAQVAPEPIEHTTPERASHANEQLRRLHRALEKIAPKKRVAFVLWALEGMDVADIAQLTEVSLSATKSRILYAQRELRQLAQRDTHLRELLQGDGDVIA